MKFIKIALRVNSKATNFAVGSELDRFPLHIKIYTVILKYWNRLSDLTGNPIIVDVRTVNEDLRVSNDYTFSWLPSIEMFSNESDWICLVLNNDNYSSKSFPTEFVKKLKKHVC